MRITLALAAAFAREAGATYAPLQEAVTFTVAQLQQYTLAIAGAVLLDEPEAHDDTETTTH